MKNTSEPVIGIPCISGTPPVFDNYVRSVKLAGGIPKKLQVVPDITAIKEQIRECDGFIFMGGPDFSADFSRSRDLPQVDGAAKLDSEVEKYYRALGEEIMFSTAKPVLGICLGCQLINLLSGGSLYSDIQLNVPGSLWHKKPSDPAIAETYHAVSIVKGTWVNRILQTGSLTVNSSHHQAVREPGKNLVVEAESTDDGITEAISLADDSRFVLGLQWHPERLCAKLDSQAELAIDPTYPVELRKLQLRFFEELCRQAAK